MTTLGLFLFLNVKRFMCCVTKVTIANNTFTNFKVEVQ